VDGSVYTQVARYLTKEQAAEAQGAAPAAGRRSRRTK
jgi:hypothetical protein